MTESPGTIGKGLQVLRALGVFPHGATAAQVVEATGRPFSTTYRILGALVDSGFVSFDPDTKRYAVGLPVFELAATVAHARGVAGTALPVLRRLMETTGESVLLMVRDGTETLTLHKVDGPAFRTTTDPGDRGPLHSSAAGKALLAALPPAERERLVRQLPLTARTPHTVTDPARLLAQLEHVAEQGWAMQSEEHDVGMRALAVVLPQPGRPPSLALALAAPVFGPDPATLETHVPVLRQAAHALALQLPTP